MNNNDNYPSQSNNKNAARSWITQSGHHTDRVHQLNVKLTGEVNAALRQIAEDENLRLYEVVEKTIAFYRQHHPRVDHS
jgi:hypothetical protein